MDTEAEESFMRLPPKITPRYSPGPPLKYKKPVSAEQRARCRLYAYGITKEMTDRLFNDQRKSCAICRRRITLDRLAVDHCHKTKRVRGLLCRPCNTGLGMFRDRIKDLQSAIDYLTGARQNSPAPPGRGAKKCWKYKPIQLPRFSGRQSLSKKLRVIPSTLLYPLYN